MAYVPPEPHERMLEEMRHLVRRAEVEFADAKLRHEALLNALIEIESACNKAIKAKAEMESKVIA